MQKTVINEIIKTTKDMEEKKINQMSLVNCDLDEVEIVLGNKFELKIKDGKYYAIRKKPKYPTDFDECCDILDIEVGRNIEHTEHLPFYKYKKQYDIDLLGCLRHFRKLLICRDAYWKIVGEEMGLGKPWEPDNDTEIYNIYRVKNTMRLDGSCWAGNSNILEFPTEEMRDAFYENFKELIEICKELL